MIAPLLCLLLVGETITVNETSDAPDADLADGVADADLGTPGLQTTLRAAIQHANTATGADLINFEGFAPDTILSSANLPEISEALVFDGTGVERLAITSDTLLVRADTTLRSLSLVQSRSDALVVESGALILENVTVAQSTGWAIKSRGSLTLTNTMLSGNMGGGALVEAGTITGENLTVEGNGGPGLMAPDGVTLNQASIRGNSSVGVRSDREVNLDGDVEISGNFGEGVHTPDRLFAVGTVEVLDNASWGARVGSVFAGRGGRFSGNGHGVMMAVPSGFAFDLTLETVTGEAVRGGGLLAAVADISAAGTLEASDNAGPGIATTSLVSAETVIALRNDGAGVQASTGFSASAGATIENNLGPGITSLGPVGMVEATINDNAGAGLQGDNVTVESGSVDRNGLLERSTEVQLDGSLFPSLALVRAESAGVVSTVFFGQSMSISDNGGDGIVATTMRLTDGTVKGNGGAGIRVSGNAFLLRTLICDNGDGDAVVQGELELDASGVCQSSTGRSRDEGCGCGAARAPVAPSGLPLLLLLAIGYTRRR